MSQKGNEINICKVEDNNFLDDKRGEYLKNRLLGGSDWVFIQEAMREVIEEYSQIIGTYNHPEHKKIVKFLLGKTK